MRSIMCSANRHTCKTLGACEVLMNVRLPQKFKCKQSVRVNFMNFANCLRMNCGYFCFSLNLHFISWRHLDRRQLLLLSEFGWDNASLSGVTNAMTNGIELTQLNVNRFAYLNPSSESCMTNFEMWLKTEAKVQQHSGVCVRVCATE